MKSINIKSSSNNYDVIIGNNILDEVYYFLNKVFKEPALKKVAIVYDLNVEKYFQQIKNSLNSNNIIVAGYSLPPGESTKSISTIYPVYKFLIENNIDRYTPVISVGGGVIGDAVGFVASTYLRGIPYIQIPTTLLSMVDSSIGGKVAINHESGKNLIGSFYPPNLVLIDTNSLETLPSREFSCGMAECIKHALISDFDLLDWTIESVPSLLKFDSDIVENLIEKNINVKADIVQRDEKESGERAYLNLGHTFAHALEKEFSYSGEILHGEAVALGLRAALYLSESKNKILKDYTEKLDFLLDKFSLPSRISKPDIDNLVENMKKDKKNQNNTIRLVLIRDIGKPYIDQNISHNEIVSAWNHIIN